MRWELLAIVVTLFSNLALVAEVDFNRDVKPILAKNCLACHGPDDGHREAGLRLDQREPAVAPRKNGPAIVVGKPALSRIIARVTAADPADRMPPPSTGNHLTSDQVSILKRWIEQGAKYAPHWAWVAPVRPVPPKVNDATWSKNAIDAFILARLESEKLRPARPADPFVKLRRASLDIRGLPPTPAEVDEFSRDARPDAYERMVDRFLSDPAYGERWARVWLDLARYADSAGYGSDPLRPNMWRWRDWVIDAFNRNLPYDQFTIQQIAGDLLPNATLETRIATAFHRNTMTNTEGGTDDEEFRVVAVKDRVDTTMQVWMGVTFGCAKCHTHKYDPITNAEYYRLFAVFNQTADNDQPDESPTLPAPSEAQALEIQRIDDRVAALRKQLDLTPPGFEQEFSDWLSRMRPTFGHSSQRVMFDNRLAASPGHTATPIVIRADGQPINGLRVTVAPESGPFQLHRIRAVTGEEGRSRIGRYVRIELPGNDRMLSLAEVQVFRNGVNIAGKGQATQSSTDYNGPAKLAIDGKTDGEFNRSKSVTHTRSESNPWWEVKLADSGPVERVVVWNRTDGNVGNRLTNFRVLVLDEKRGVVWQQADVPAPKSNREFHISGPQSIPFADAWTELAGTSPGRVLASNDDTNGWTVDAAKGSQALILALDKPLSITKDTQITLRIAFQGVAKVQIAAVNDPRIGQRLMEPSDVRAIVDIPAATRTVEQVTRLKKQFLAMAPSLKPLRDEITALEKSRPKVDRLPVMQELAASNRRKTRIMIKGDFLNPGEEVTASLPAAFHRSTESRVDRLALANWLVHPNNPLTARVAVNRIWAQLFGAGIVETEEDFGTQGEPPTHPELLDWLATEYVRLGWDTKALIRLIVMSATYAQSAKTTPEVLVRDPRNRLLARAPRYRLEAEMVRDQALALSGLLSRKIGGPSVYPPQPANLWQAAFNGQRSYPTSTGEDKYRRGLYTFWRRTVPYPSMTAFDAPSRETCSIRRSRTNTPSQAFVTLNDPVFVEAAQSLARRIIREGGKSPEERVRFALRLVLCRPPAEAQQTPLLQLYREELNRLAKDAKSAAALATDVIGPLPKDMNVTEAAAWTVVANVLLNLDAVLTKG
jgi:hypothetical protein